MILTARHVLFVVQIIEGKRVDSHVHTILRTYHAKHQCAHDFTHIPHKYQCAHDFTHIPHKYQCAHDFTHIPHKY